jgi:asparagine synthase (glutamine-hydrolysing)
LSGLGGDELFGGYPSFRQIPNLLKWGRRVPFSKSVGHAIETVMRTMPAPGLPPKTAGLLSHSSDIASCYLLRRALHIENELDLLLDESWLKEGVERLSTIEAIGQTVAALQTAGVSVHAQVAAIESCWYMRNQLLRDTDWSSMAHGLEVRVPFVDATMLERLGPAIASDRPPNKRDLAACAQMLPQAIFRRRKTGFTTPVRAWIGITGKQARGLRGWAADVHRQFRGHAPLSSAA